MKAGKGGEVIRDFVGGQVESLSTQGKPKHFWLQSLEAGGTIYRTIKATVLHTAFTLNLEAETSPRSRSLFLMCKLKCHLLVLRTPDFCIITGVNYKFRASG